MPDIFGRQPSPLKGAFSADAAFAQFFGVQAAGQVVQQMQVQYTQQVETIFEVGSNFKYYVVGKPTGNMSLGRVVGPSNQMLAILQRLGNPCSGGDKTTTITLGNAGCFGNVQGGQLQYKMSDCIASSYGFSTEAQRFLVQDQVGITFSMLESLGAGANGGAIGNIGGIGGGGGVGQLGRLVA